MKDINENPKMGCYCGQSGDQNRNMLYCVKCRRWLHEACVKCLDVPMLLGDRFYILICSVCNAGSECLARIELTWSDVTHLALYNLTVEHKTKYFDLDKSIIPFLLNNWERLRLFGPVASVKPDDRRTKVLDVLLNDNRFKSGREIKKSKNIFGLRQRTPPDPPLVQPSAAKLQNDTVVWEFQVMGRPYKLLTAKKPKIPKESAKNGKPKSKLLTSQSRSKQIEVSKCHGGLPYNENGIVKTKGRPKRSTNAITFSEEAAKDGLLDTLIPAPPAFTRENNPFQQPSQASSVKRINSQVRKPQSSKRRHNGALVEPLSVTSEHKHKLLVNKASTPSAKSVPPRYDDSDMLFDAKEYFLSQPGQTAKEDGLSVVGKRLTKTGKVQYLFQKDRAKMESEMADMEPLFTIRMLCHCAKCNIINLD